MGFNTVAVLYNDFNFAKQPLIGGMIQDAIRGWSMRDRDHLATHFGAGMVVSQAHADHTQIVAVGQNRGRPIHECHDLDYMALSSMAECLVRHGWTARPPAKKRTVRKGES